MTATEGVENPDRDVVSRVLDNIEADPHRRSEEKQTSHAWSAADDHASVHTAEPALMRRFLNYPEFELRWFEYPKETDSWRTTTAVLSEDNDWDGEDVYSVAGVIPVGAVTVKSQSRQTNQHSQIVSGAVLREEP